MTLHPYDTVSWRHVGPPHSDAWMAAHGEYLTGSISAKACGVSEWGQPLDVYCSMRGLTDPFDGNEYTEFGNRWERFGIEDYLHTYACAGCCPKEFIAVHPTIDYIAGCPDLLIYTADQGASSLLYDYPLPMQWAWGVDIKTAKSSGDPKWGEEGTDAVPLDYWMQAQHYMLLFGVERWDIYTYFRAECQYRLYTIARSDKVIETLMLPAYADLWRRVQEGDPPPVDHNKANALALVERLAPAVVVKKEIALPDDAGPWIEQYHVWGNAEKVAKERKGSAKARLLEMMGDAQTGVCAAGKVTRSFVKGGDVSYTRNDGWQLRVTPSKSERNAL